MVQFEDDPLKQLEKINGFFFQACSLTDESSQKIINDLKSADTKNNSKASEKPVNTNNKK